MVVKKMLRDHIKKINNIAKLAHIEGYMRSGGNISIKFGNRIIITPHGYVSTYLCDAPCNKFNIVSLDGSILKRVTPSVELEVHLNIYNSFRDLSSIIHMHTPNILVMINEEDELFETYQCKVNQYSPFIFTSTAQLRESQLVDMVNYNKKYGLAIIVKDHGVFVGGTSLEKAYYLLSKLDDTAKVEINERIVRQ